MKSFKVSNFRLFGEGGAEIIFKPVTILTGTNSSGKSSYVKSFVLFRDYINRIANEYRRDGSFDPSNIKLDFSNPKLRFKGYSSVRNKFLREETPMRFSYELCPTVSCYGGYRVTFSFTKDKNDTLDQGTLASIEVDIDNEKVIKLVTNTNGALVVEYFNNSKLLSDFIGFCRFAYLPFCIIDSSYGRYSVGVDPEFCDTSTNQFDENKAAKTEIGKRLASIQRRETPFFTFSSIVDNLPEQYYTTYKSLLTKDLFDSVEKCIENDIIFYFPVLECFKGKDKKDAISILLNEAKPGASLDYIKGGSEFFNEDLKTLVDDFQNSDFDSFIDYYRELENYILENVNPRSINLTRMGRSFNFIEDRILEKLNVSYDNDGMGLRDKTETMFSVAYNVLSNWQWAVSEKNDYVWSHYNDGAITELWGKDDNFIHRAIDSESNSFCSRHILWDAYKDYVRLILLNCLIPDDFLRLEYNTGSFARVQRLHSFEEKSDFVMTIKSYLSGRSFLLSKANDFKFLVGKENRYIPDTFLNKWLGPQGFAIGKKLLIEEVEGLGFKILIEKDNSDVEALADMGHGVTQMVSILIQIEDAIIKNEIEELKRIKKEGGNRGHDIHPIIAIEEPEVSLHPKYQSMLADVFMDAATNYGTGVTFLIETHSEYLVRKSQAIVSDFSTEQMNNNPFVVYYFRENGELYDMEYTESGRFLRNFDTGFFDETAKSRYSVLRKEEEIESTSNNE